jgi:protein-S-isoprenylcysteine O-methyltransferase Ste14
MATDVKATEHRESGASRIVRLVAMVCAVALLWLPSVPLPILNERFLPFSAWSFWSGAAITAVGLLFSVWARRHLGKNWSQAVTVKQNHELITSGPYALVRHPIYTGLLLGFLGSAVARGEWRGLLAVALVFGALWNKLKLEEKVMRAQFGGPYETYSRRVAALVPYIV